MSLSRTASTILALSALCCMAFGDSANTTKRSVNQLAEGVYEIRHPDAPDTFPQGNTTVIIGDKAVLVVDSCLLPSSARQDIEQIRRWTDKPVAYLVNTHWHFDHTLGNETYAAAFPGLQIIAQSETRRLIQEINQNAVLNYPNRKRRFEEMLSAGKDQDGIPIDDATRRDLQRSLQGLSEAIDEFKGVTQKIPNISFDHSLTIDLGNRVVEIKFLGRGNTSGDTVVFLPKDKILVVGDLLDHPVPYFFGGFPVDLVSTLAKIEQIDPAQIIPGHGDIMRDTVYLRQVSELVTSVQTEVEKAINEGKKLPEVMEAVPKRIDVASFKRKFAGEDKENRDAFDETFSGLIKSSFNQLSLR